MRNTTKLKNLLIRYDCEFSMDEFKSFKLYMTDKWDIEQSVHVFEAPNYSSVLAKAYSYFLKHEKIKQKNINGYGNPEV